MFEAQPYEMTQMGSYNYGQNQFSQAYYAAKNTPGFNEAKAPANIREADYCTCPSKWDLFGHHIFYKDKITPELKEKLIDLAVATNKLSNYIHFQSHRESVFCAVRENKPIDPEILKQHFVDYPDLKF